ncbi:cytoplasmic tRNA 2-thiolation protein 2 [Lambiella insularis]|nr:cytoplasmic tRNA 2-thiolation protein 2 [Lambiella insularis]
MSSKTALEVPEISQRMCVRCQASSATVNVRTEQLCRECFMNYVGSKVVKRMDCFKVRSKLKDRQRRVLLPLSLGTSSVALLHLLDQQLRIQKERTGHVGYTIHVLFVEDQGAGTGASVSEILSALKKKYADHSFTTVPLDDVYRYSSKYDGDELTNPTVQIGQERPLKFEAPPERLRVFLASLSSPTSRCDIVGILRMRLIVGFAKAMACESIIWGDSATRLAERTLAEAAKGRGFSIPWQIADGASPYGIQFVFPMRDLLRKEILMYSRLTAPPLTALAIELSHASLVSASSKDMTIDGLMSQYFESVEQNYPSIVANVVRTSGRLQAPVTSNNPTLCGVCRHPVASSTAGLHGWGGDQGKAAGGAGIDPLEYAGHDTVCYGCSRLVNTSTKSDITKA